MIKIFQGEAGVVTPSKPPPPKNNFCLYPAPVLRCFWKDLLMTPTPTTPLQASFTATPLPIHHHFPPLKILIIHLAAVRWAPCWANQDVIIHSDNQPAVTMPNKGTTHNPLVMLYLWHLFWLSATCNFQITAKYIPGLESYCRCSITYA